MEVQIICLNLSVMVQIFIFKSKCQIAHNDLQKVPGSSAAHFLRQEHFLLPFLSHPRMFPSFQVVE